MKAKNKLKKAFTLIELVVVIAVIAVLAGVSVAAYFGVTESAKKSNLESKEEQINTLFTTYQLENGSDLSSFSKTELNNYMLGFSNYLLENGLNEDESFKYKVVELINTSKTRSNEDNDSSKLGVIFLIREDNYYKYNIYDVSSSSMINLDDSLTESSIFKSEEEVKYDIVTNSGSFLSSKDISSIESSSSLNGAFLPILKEDEEGNEEYIIPYYLYLLDKDNDGNNEEYYVPITSTLLDEYNDVFKDYELNAVNKEGLTVYDTSFDITFTDSNEKFDISKVYTFDDNSEPTLNEYDYYLVNTITLNYETRNIDVSNINLDNYETSLISSDQSQVYYFSTLDQFINEYNEGSLSSFGEGTYLFVGTATLDQDFTVPSGWTMVVDFLNTTDDMKDLMNNYGGIENISGLDNKTKNNKRRGIDFFKSVTGEANGIEQKLINQLKINAGVVLTINGNLRVEGFVGVSSGGKGYGIGNHSEILNNGEIILNNDSNLKAIGYINGEGRIKANSGSTVYEVFQFQDFRGGTISTGFYLKKAFPLNLYNVSNISCNLDVNYKSTYKFISSVYASSKYTDMSLPFVSDSEGLFIMEEGSTITKNIVDNKFNLIFKEGNFHDSSMSFKISGQNVNSSDYLFPFSNMNLIVDEKAALKLSESNAKYSILPNSSLTIKGNLNLENNVKIVVLDSSQNYYSSIINLVEECSYDLNLYEYLKKHQIDEQFIIESGTLNISENSAIYASTIQNNNGKIINQSLISDEYKYVVPTKYAKILGFGADWGTVNLPIFK